MSRDFLGIYDLFADALSIFEYGVHDRVTDPSAATASTT